MFFTDRLARFDRSNRAGEVRGADAIPLYHPIKNFTTTNLLLPVLIVYQDSKGHDMDRALIKSIRCWNREVLTGQFDVHFHVQMGQKILQEWPALCQDRLKALYSCMLILCIYIRLSNVRQNCYKIVKYA
eukprot:1142012-Pelagomonas_calceolata.AAC.2